MDEQEGRESITVSVEHLIAMCELRMARKTEVYEDLTRPRNDPYANGEYSGYMHAMRDILSHMERVKWSAKVMKAGLVEE